MTFCVNDDDKFVVVMPAIKKNCILALYIMNSIFSFIARENFHKCTCYFGPFLPSNALIVLTLI